MGQLIQKEIPPQRIRPPPGSTGVNVKPRNTISIYSDITHSIRQVQVDFSMTMNQFKQLFKGQSLQFEVNSNAITENLTLAELGLNENSLLKVTRSREIISSSSEGEDDSDIPRGPKPIPNDQPVKPDLYEESEDPKEFSPYDLPDISVYAVPDFQLINRRKYCIY